MSQINPMMADVLEERWALAQPHSCPSCGHGWPDEGLCDTCSEEHFICGDCGNVKEHSEASDTEDIDSQGAGHCQACTSCEHCGASGASAAHD